MSTIHHDLLQKICENLAALNQLTGRPDLTEKLAAQETEMALLETPVKDTASRQIAILVDIIKKMHAPKRQFIQLVDADGNLLWINQSDVIQAYTRPAHLWEDGTIDRPAKLYLMIREVYGSDGANSLALDFDLGTPQARALMDWLDQNGEILSAPDQEEE